MRFPGFEGEWEIKKLGELTELITKGTTPKKFVNKGVKFIKIECFDGNMIDPERCLFIDEEIHNKELKRSILKENDLLFAIAGATIGKVNFVNNEILPANTNQALAIIRLKKTENSKFVYQILKSDIMHRYIKDSISVGAQPNLNLQQMNEFSFFYPSISEQQKIGSFLYPIDERIATQKKIIEVLKTLKVQTRKKLIVKIIKEDYEPLLVKEILNYEQPTKYIVLNTDYSDDKGLTPVLTANKSFILGYTDENFGIYEKGNCIILDDFTMDLKYVNFPFKVKSSAIKILKAKEGINLKFVFEYFSFANFSSNEHKRHYISEIEKMSIVLPKIEIQNKIARFLTALDEKINLEIDLLTQYELQKRYLLSNLFV